MGSAIGECREVIHSSQLLAELKTCLGKFDIRKIRCLALGSFAEDFPAKYQLALLLEMLDAIGAGAGADVEVSIYDPVFNESDKEFIGAQDNWQIVEVERYDEAAKGVTLFYMPHAPLDLTEEVLAREKPQLILGNELSRHTDRYTEQQLHEKYPLLSKLVYNSKNYNGAAAAANRPDDGFVKQESKRARRRKNNRWCPPDIDYSSIDSYFNEGVTLITDFMSANTNAIKEKQEQWNHSFSDLALFEIK